MNRNLLLSLLFFLGSVIISVLVSQLPFWAVLLIFAAIVVFGWYKERK